MWKVIQNHSFKHQLIRDILTAIGTIVIFVWTIFSYKLYKQIFLINILAASVWKLWPVWFNFGCFQHISALKSIKYPRECLKESQHSQCPFYTTLDVCSTQKIGRNVQKLEKMVVHTTVKMEHPIWWQEQSPTI